MKLARFSLIPASVLHLVAEHYGKGALKYEDRNWEKGYNWSLSFDALMRHAWAWWGGEDEDPETGSSHMVAVVFHAMALLWFSLNRKQYDDRPKMTCPHNVVSAGYEWGNWVCNECGVGGMYDN